MQCYIFSFKVLQLEIKIRLIRLQRFLFVLRTRGDEHEGTVLSCYKLTTLSTQQKRPLVSYNTVCRRQPRFVSAKAEQCFRKAKNDVASLLANDVVSCRHKHKKKDTTFIVSFFLCLYIKIAQLIACVVIILICILLFNHSQTETVPS